MSWAENILLDSVQRSQFVRLTARLKLLSTDFTLHSGSVYYASVTRGPVHTFERDGVAYTAQASTSLSSGQFYYDRAAKRLYIYSTGAPSASDFHCAHIYLFFASREILWHETPTDSSSEVVEWSPILKQAPSYKVVIPPLALGLFPVEPSALVVVNDGTLNYLLKNASFNRASCEVWERFGTMESTNIAKKLTAMVGFRVAATREQITFDVVDKALNFDATISGAYYTGTGIDPKFRDTAAMKIWGYTPNVEEYHLFEMVNLDYDADAPTTSNNRKFAIVYDPNAEYTEIVVAGTLRPGGAVNRFTPTTPGENYLFRGQDQVWFDGTADQSLIVDNIDLGSVGDISFTTNPSGGGDQAGSLKISMCREVFIIQGDTSYRLKYGRDFTDTLHTGNFRGITLTATAEANVGCATFDPNTDTVWCGPVGKRAFPTHAAVAFGDTAPEHRGAFGKGCVILYDFLKDECGLSEDEIDFDSIDDATATVDWTLFLPVPMSGIGDYPSQREMLDLILKSMTLRAFFDGDGKFSVRPYRVITAPANSILKEELSDYAYDIDYSEVTKVQFAKAYETGMAQHLGYSGTKDEILNGTAQISIIQGPKIGLVADATGSDEASYLHKTDKSLVVEHIVSIGGDFEDRVRDLYGERSGLMKIEGKKIALDLDPADDVTVYRDSMVGFDDAVGNNANFEISEIEKADDKVIVSLGDNKAAQDKSSEIYW